MRTLLRTAFSSWLEARPLRNTSVRPRMGDQANPRFFYWRYWLPRPRVRRWVLSLEFPSPHFHTTTWPSSLPLTRLTSSPPWPHLISTQHPDLPHFHSTPAFPSNILTYLSSTQHPDPTSSPLNILTPPHFHSTPWPSSLPLNILTHLTSTQHPEPRHLHSSCWPASLPLSTLTHRISIQFPDTPHSHSPLWPTSPPLTTLTHLTFT